MSLRDQRRPPPPLALSDADLGSSASVDDEEDENGGSSSSNGSGGSVPPAPAPIGPAAEQARHWRDVFWLGVFVFHLLAFGVGFALLGINHFSRADRLNIDRFTNITGGGNFSQAPVPQQQQQQQQSGRVELTETYWPFYGVAGAAGALVAWAWLSLMGTHAIQMMKVSVHGLTTYLAVISVLCFWTKHFFWGVAFAVGAALQFLYVMSVMDRKRPDQCLYVCGGDVALTLSINVFFICLLSAPCADDLACIC